MGRGERLDRLSEVWSDQGGYLTASQAGRLGVDRKELAELAGTGDLRRVRRGVYAVRGSRNPFEAEIAAWLSIDRSVLPWEWTTSRPQAVLSHRSAAALWHLGTVIPALPALTVRNHPSRGRDLELHTAALPSPDWCWHSLEGGIRVPVTTPARTVVDLAVAGEEPSYVHRALREAAVRRIASAADVKSSIARRPRKGRALDALLAEISSL